MMTDVKNISSTETSGAKAAPLKVLLAAGGTGGHVYPAISIADALRAANPDTSVLFVGTRDRMEWEAVPKSGYDIKSVWISGFHRRLTPQNLLFPFKLATSLMQSWLILRRFRPDVVVACGGFAAGPVGWVAARMNIPVVIQEQNSYPGVTNRLLARHAEIIFTAFPDAASFLPKEKIRLEGNPVRSQLQKTEKTEAMASFGLDDDSPVLLVLGGSGGALAINKAMLDQLDELHDALGLQIIWQCGEKYFKNLRNELDEEEYSNLKLVPYIDDMTAAYSAADLVLTRAGAGTCSELMMLGQPAILVPSPNVAGDHQAKNAKSMTDSGAAIRLDEKNLDTLSAEIKKLIFNENRLSEMAGAMKKLAKPDAAKIIANEIITLAEKHHE